MGVTTDTTEAPPAPEDGTEYRGHKIVKKAEGSFAVYRHGFLVTRCGSHWSCICYIDEKLAP